MTILPKTPSAKTFTAAWMKEFTRVATEAAGRDGRLSLTEAKRIAERSGLDSFFSDNAVNYLAAKGQKTVSVKVLLESAAAYAGRAATAAAGPDGKLSLADGKKLPKDLAADFFAMRGVTQVTADPRTAAELRADVRDAALTALDNGTAKQLASPPAILKGRQPLEAGIAHPGSNTRFDTYVADGRVYVSRASDSPSPLVGFWDVGPVPAANTGRAELRAAVEAAAKGMTLMSESDAKVVFLNGGSVGTAPVTDALVRQKLGAAHDQYMPNIFGWNRPDSLPLAQRKLDANYRDAQTFLAHAATVYDPNDPAAAEYAQKWAALGKLLNANLTDLKLFRYGDYEGSIVIVGRTKSGDLAGVLTAVVET